MIKIGFEGSAPEEMPEGMAKLVGLLAEPNIELREVDKKMGWEEGTALRLLREYPILRRTAAESRMLAMKAAGLEKVGAYETIGKVMKEAVKRVPTGGGEFEDVVDWKERREAARDVIGLHGESLVGPVRVEQSMTKIMIDIKKREEIIRVVREELRKRGEEDVVDDEGEDAGSIGEHGDGKDGGN